MDALTAAEIRRSIVNGSRRDVSEMNLPADLDSVDWERLDYLGWRDPKAPLRGYLVVQVDDRVVGLILRSAETSASARKSAMCQLCRAPRPGDEITLFTARRAGHAGRELNTVGTYICADLTCSAQVRVPLPPTPQRPDPAVATAQAIAGLHERMGGFVASVLRD